MTCLFDCPQCACHCGVQSVDESGVRVECRLLCGRPLRVASVVLLGQRAPSLVHGG